MHGRSLFGHGLSGDRLSCAQSYAMARRARCARFLDLALCLRRCDCGCAQPMVCPANFKGVVMDREVGIVSICGSCAAVKAAELSLRHGIPDREWKKPNHSSKDIAGPDQVRIRCTDAALWTELWASFNSISSIVACNSHRKNIDSIIPQILQLMRRPELAAKSAIAPITSGQATLAPKASPDRR